MKRPSSDLVVQVLAALVLLAAGAWFVSASEWVEVWRRLPRSGAAASDEHYAVKQLATRLGAQVQAPQNLAALPPPGATLVLRSHEWDFLPGRSEQLRVWVEQGGHLVLPSYSVTGQDIEWVPMTWRPAPRQRPQPNGTPRDRAEGDDDEDDPPPRPPPPPDGKEDGVPPYDRSFVGPRRVLPPCPLLAESGSADGVTPPRRLRLCNGQWSAQLMMLAPAQAVWSIDGPHGAHTLRTTLGQGRITAIGEHALLDNDMLFRGDHTLAIVSALDLRPGSDIWFVMDERRDALAVWLWHRAGPALLLAALALVLVLWRGALRFGPLLPVAPVARRSVAEQIRGTAAFVLRGGGAPLLVAARRALDEAARQRITGYARMTMAERIAALQRPTAMDKVALTRALDPQMPPRGPGRQRALADKLALIEQARRRLVFNAPPPA